MISPSNLLKRVGAHGRLLPFFQCVCVYFAAGGAGGAGGAGSVAAKCAPVLCLLLLVLLHHGPRVTPRGRYARRIALGLGLSCAGDALLVWPQRLVAGMAVFAGAHAAYLSAFGFRPRAGRVALACYAGAALYAGAVRPAAGAAGGALRVLVPAYSALLATMAWRGVARGGSARAGAALFLLSDAVLGYTLFGSGYTIPHAEVLVMSTYYLGQLGIALSALEEPAPASASAPAPVSAPAPLVH